jgi:UDP-glucose 4-epimerase
MDLTNLVEHIRFKKRSDMKALVTGGAGFIGSNLVDKLIELDYDVVVIDDESSECNKEFYWNESSDNHKIDIVDYNSTRPLYDGVDVVFHLAAESRIQPAIENPLRAVTTNALGTATVLQCAREAGVKRVIYSSTSSAYGRNIPPCIENMREDCLNPYSVSKVTGEKLCSMYSELYGLETIILRYFNVYGERQPLKGHYAPVVGLFLRQAQNGEPLTIVGDGEQRRDFTHVSDVVNANIITATADVEKVNFGHVYNVGTGVNYSVNELANMISENKVNIDPRPGESRLTLANIEKIKTVFKWEPKVSIRKWIENNKMS